MSNNSVITRKQVMNRLKNVKLEDYTREDLLESFIVYGEPTELLKPYIQKMLVNNNLCVELLEMIDIITDKNVIQDVLKSKLLKQDDIYAVEGKISAIEIVYKIKDDSGTDDEMYHTMVNFEDTQGNQYHILGNTFNEKEDVQAHIATLEPYYNNIVVILEKKHNKSRVIGFLQKYE